MSEEIWKAYTHGIAAAINEGGIYIPSMLLRSYNSLGISESEAMLIFQIMQYTDVERNDFPTLEQLADRMGTNVRNIGTMLGRLMKDGFLTIDDYIDSESGMQAERYNWSGWLMKAAEWSATAKREAKKLNVSLPHRKLNQSPTCFLFLNRSLEDYCLRWNVRRSATGSIKIDIRKRSYYLL